MFSRVAAVKAPRTHNRRCVTGSSGRRREGREGEPRRPHMSRRVFASAVLPLFLFVMMCCGTGGAAANNRGASGQESSPGNCIDWRDIKTGEKVGALHAPSLVEVNGDVFAVAEAQCTKDEGCIFTGIASELLELSDKTKKKELDESKLKTQVLDKCASLEEGQCPSQAVKQDGSQRVMNIHVGRPTTIVTTSQIYMLAGNYSRTAAAGTQKSKAHEWGLLLVRGNVSEEQGKKINWNDTYRFLWTDLKKQHESWSGLIGGGGSGIRMEDGTFLFPVEGTNEKNGTTVSLIIYFSANEGWTLSKGMSADGCSDPSVVEREKGKLMMMTACDGRRRVYESADKGESWTEVLGTLSRVWGNNRKLHERGVRSGFITARIDGVVDNRNVMLVTLPVYPKEDSKKETDNRKGKLHLWLTDNTHIVDIGPVSDDDAAASSLLYRSGESETNKKEELIALYEKEKSDEGKPSPGMVSVLLTAQLQRVKDVLATWKEVDDRVSELCPSERAAKDTPTYTACSAGKITAGLVGFLSGNFSGSTWRDEYLGVNAKVKNKDGATEDAGAARTTKTSDGVNFTGAWAEWPVGSQGENQLYHFANYNFTLVATVSIDGEPKEGSPITLMGAKKVDDNNPVLFGLSYDKEKKWQVLCSDGPIKEHSSAWEKDTAHHVVILLRNGSQGSAYVDGQRVGEDVPCELKVTESNEISHFYIGGDGGSAGSKEDVPVTVTNVLLYNRPLSTAEIGAFNPNNVLIPPVVPDNAQGTQSQSSSAGQPPSGHKLLNENEGAVGGSTSPSTPSTITNSGKEQSVIQPPSGISSGGNKHVDAASSSDGDPRVGAEAGGAMQGDTPPQTPVDTPDTADANTPTATDVAQVGPAATTEVGASSGANEEAAGGTDGQEEGVHARDRGVNATALSSSLGNVTQGNNSDAGTVRGSGLLPSLLLMLGLWVFAAL
ncbi:putative trans-sialidase, Group V [Trypanosoma cruzi]|uniref:Trans-sialidase, putative n=2 Tax=Trypanosoma cruzi TaxID=5693 RepID=Q4DH26_TRYCC|nr:trans-sialidase, putative [Trypanosoma cruzi]EAN91826.1 trans-sialidase, putative [Trypanosoma cruzi]PWU97891.1 putative trans-sialidase, Group V [Trypanosoma cruzi]|eukprot:XP_813677.1 trans-sialidase [Trypanosoma cruzi strain CL Brener]